MSAPVDMPQNLQIHVAPAERVPQAKQPEKGDNHQQEFQDFFQRSEKDRIHREEKHRREKDHLPKQNKTRFVENTDDYDNKGGQSADEKPDDLNLGNNVDMLA